MTRRYIRKDEDLLESSWRAFWIAHDIILMGILLEVRWKPVGSHLVVSWELAGSQLGVRVQ